MRTSLAVATVFALAAAPAAAVTVTGVSATRGNGVTVISQGPGLLEVDFLVRATSPIRIDVSADAEETGFGFNSLVDIFTAVEMGQNVRSLTLSLTGATFTQIGDIAPSFAGFSTSLNSAATLLTITFEAPGEPNAVLLGSLAGTRDFGISFDPNSGSAASLSLQAAVPEPATWAMLIIGFGSVGATLRRRRTTLAANA